MRTLRLTTRSVRALVVLLLPAGAIAAVSPVAAAAARARAAGLESFTASGNLYGVAATSATNALAPLLTALVGTALPK
jgi:hypothetical protein